MDIRVFTRDQIRPPHPLPHVSRDALKRIGNGNLNPPTVCPFCEAAVVLVNNSEIYGRSYGDWPYAYSCTGCDSHVGVHKDSDLPLGTLANKALRDARKLKTVFFELQEAQGWSRSQAYRWLANKLEISIDMCHWGWFNEDRCHKAHKLCLNKLKGE